MIRPSDLLDVATYDAVSPDALRRYLNSRGWRCVYESWEEKRLCVSWFYHDELPAIKLNRQTSPPTTGYASASNIPAVIDVPDIQWLVKIVSPSYADYGVLVADLFADLERHEDRWRGAILDDVLAIEEAEVAAKGSAK